MARTYAWKMHGRLEGRDEGVGPVKATFAGWSCPAGPAELVDYLVDDAHAEEVPYDEFAGEVDVSTAPLEEGQLEILSTDWHVNWLLPSGGRAWVMQHSGIEHLFLDGGFDHGEESRLAEVWAAAQ